MPAYNEAGISFQLLFFRLFQPFDFFNEFCAQGAQLCVGDAEIQAVPIDGIHRLLDAFAALSGDGGFFCAFSFLAEVIPQADVAVVIDTFADGLPLERVDEAIAFRLRIADTGVLRLALIVAVEVVIGGSLHTEERPCPGARSTATPIVDAENVAVGVDVAVLLEAAIRVATGAVPPESVAIVQRFFAKSVVGFFRAAGHVGDVVVAAVVQPWGEMLTDEIAVACVKRLETRLFHKF